MGLLKRLIGGKKRLKQLLAMALEIYEIDKTHGWEFMSNNERRHFSLQYVKEKSDVKQMQRELHPSYDGAVVSEFVWLAAGDLMRYRPTVKMICVLLCM